MPAEFRGIDKKAIIEREKEIDEGDVWDPLIRHYFPSLDPSQMTYEERARILMDVTYIEKRITRIMANAIVMALDGGN